MSFYNNPLAELIAKKLMEDHSMSSIFLGMQKNDAGNKWQSDWYTNLDTNYSIPDDKISTFIKSQVLIATLTSSDTNKFSYSSADGYKKEGAICEFGKLDFMIIQVKILHLFPYIFFQLVTSHTPTGELPMICLNHLMIPQRNAFKLVWIIMMLTAMENGKLKIVHLH